MLYYTHEQEITGRGDGKFINSRENVIKKYQVSYKTEVHKIYKKNYRRMHDGDEPEYNNK